MSRKMKKLIILLLTSIFIFSLGLTALAEEDEGEKGEGYKKSEYLERSDDEGKESGNRQVSPQQKNAPAASEIQSEYWNIWSKKPLNSLNNTLPISTPAEMSVIIRGQESKLFFIPKEGQLFVSADAIAQLLGAQSKYYSQSNIMVLTRDKTELVVRIDSNAAYVNRVKYPMPVKAVTYENTVYLPVSVATNTFGYRITFNSEKNALNFDSI